MKSRLLLFCFLLFISKSRVFVQGACTIDGISQSAIVINIDDTKVDTNIYEGTFDGTVSSCSATSDIQTAYFKVYTEDTTLKVDTTAEFGNFDNDTPKSTVATVAVTLNCVFECPSSNQVTIQIQVTDTNNHEPEFKSASYEFKVPMPVMPMTDFTIYGTDPIIATDIDFSNQGITFTIEPEDFTITTIATSDSKDYTASFASKSILNIIESRTYELTATDAGNPALSSTVIVTIVVDADLSLDIPSFAELSYSFNYSIDNNAPMITANQDGITLLTNKASGINVELTGDYSTYFIALHVTGTSSIEFNVIGQLPEDVPNYIILTLAATTDNTATTSLIIHVPPSTAGVQFSNHYYTGVYDDISDTVTLDNAITVISGTTPKVSIAGDYFETNYDEESKSYGITVKKSVPISEFKEQSYITVLITASIEDYSDTATLILSLTEHVLQFTEPFYSASYTTDNTVELGGSISFTTDVSRVNIKISDPYSEFFKIEQETGKNNYLLSVSNALTDDILKEEKELILTLTASDLYENVAHTVVNLQLPQVTDSPLFSELVYEATYTADGDNSLITTDKDILISNRDDQSNIKISLQPYDEYFTANYKDNKWSLIVSKPLEQDILTSEKEIILTLTAKEENNDLTSQAVVVIHWLVKDAPEFSEQYYKGVYPESGTGTIELDQAININNVEDQNNVKIELSSYETYFSIEYSSNNWILTATNPLGDDITSSELVIVLNAKETDNEKEGHSVLVLELPTKLAPEFEKVYYIADYPKNGEGEVVLEEAIKLNNVNDQNDVKITLDSDDYDTYFGIQKVEGEDNTYEVIVLEPLPENILETETNLILTLVGEVDGTQTYATLVINLPTTGSSRIRFTETLYTGNYNIVDEKGSLSTDTVSVETEEEDANVLPTISSSSGFESYFQVAYADKQITVSLVEDTPIPTETLRNNAFIPLVITVTIEGTTIKASSVLNIEINYEEEERSIDFSSILYEGQYKLNDEQKPVLTYGEIKIITDESDDNIEVKITNEYASYFVVSHTENLVTITAPEPLELADSVSVIPLTLQATIKDTTYSSSAVLNLVINNDGDADSIQFSSVLYTGEYTVVSGEGQLSTNEIKVITTAPDANVEPSIDPDYSKYFSISYANNIISIGKLEDLPSDILENSFVAVTLTVQIKDTEHTSSAVLNINIHAESTDKTISFSRTLYAGVLEVTEGIGALSSVDTISLITEETDDDVEVLIANEEFENFFSAVYSNGEVTIKIDEQLPEGTITNSAVISLVLQAEIKGTSVRSSAVLNLLIEYDGKDDTDSIEFDAILYSGVYSESDGKGEFALDGTIKVVTTSPDDLVEVSISEGYKDYFTVAYTDHTVNLELNGNLPSEIVEKDTFIALTITVVIKDTIHSASAVLNIQIQSESQNLRSIEFSNVLYKGEYDVVGDKGTLTITDEISLRTDESDSDVVVTISNSNGYDSFFDVAYSNKIVTVTLNNPLSLEALSVSVVPLTLHATIEGTSQTASAVLNIDILYEGHNDTQIQFTSILYTGQYSVKDEHGVLTINDPIKVVTNSADDDVEASIADLEYQDYFTVTYADQTVTVALNEDLPSDVVSQNTIISLTLVVGIKDTTHSSYSVLNIHVQSDNNQDQRSITFSNVLYNGVYDVASATLDITDEISITTDQPDDDVSVTITNTEYLNYFSVEYSNKIVTVTKTQQLPDTIQFSMVTLTLQATIIGTENTDSAVLNIELQRDGEDTDSVQFSSVLFTGVYRLGDGTAKLEVETPVSIITNRPGDIQVAISEDSEHSEYFKLTYSDHIITVDVDKNLPGDIIEANSLITLTLVATIEGTTHTSSAVLNVQLSNNAIAFSNILYSGEYDVNDGKAALTINDKISIETDAADSAVILSISGDYVSYFSCTYANKVVTINLIKELPSDTVKKLAVIPLKLQATVLGDTASSSAVLNIEIKNHDNSISNSDDKSALQHLRITFTVVTAVLSVLLLICIIAALAFYFLKIRGENYANLEEDGSGKVRFGKNFLTRSSSNKSSALEERRPTGFIFNPISEESSETGDVDVTSETDRGRRKSVAFNDNVEKMQLDHEEDTDYSSDKSQVTHV